MTLTHTPHDTTSPESTPKPTLILSPLEARVLATLMEKARTVPDSYPLSLNALTLGCNQKTTREPVMNLSDAEVLEALASLKERNLVRENSGSRVTRFEHNFQRGIGVPEQSAVLLGVLMLRGPQTAAELRLNTERWYKFADVSSVEGFLEELQDRSIEKGGALVVKLAKAPGAREQRWAHLLCGPVDMAPMAALRSLDRDSGVDTGERIERLEAEVAALRETVQRLCAELGVEMH
ncbi:MAG: DUF480 domain-containing protein [Comamonadaceae bacterium CG_4_9_14_0_8_um_filter_60_18]|nr:MAG: DUF480 domain-containing protein [Comamonadaceae bacterium CG_4_9_14_0_8_um_filter_60_18]